jgi:intraflagellar transport protein 88
MTSVNGAGYSSSDASGKAGGFDPLNQGARGPAAALQEKTEHSAEERAKELEKGVNRLLEQSAESLARRQPAVALERAKEAGRRERALGKARAALGAEASLDLTFAVLFNLAHMVRAAGLRPRRRALCGRR